MMPSLMSPGAVDCRMKTGHESWLLFSFLLDEVDRERERERGHTVFVAHRFADRHRRFLIRILQHHDFGHFNPQSVKSLVSPLLLSCRGMPCPPRGAYLFATSSASMVWLLPLSSLIEFVAMAVAVLSSSSSSSSSLQTSYNMSEEKNKKSQSCYFWLSSPREAAKPSPPIPRSFRRSDVPTFRRSDAPTEEILFVRLRPTRFGRPSSCATTSNDLF